MKRKYIIWFVLINIVFLAILTYLLYPRGGGGHVYSYEENNLLEWVKAGGIWGHIILLLGVIAFVMGTFYIFRFFLPEATPPEVIDELQGLVKNGQYDNAIALCRAHPSSFTRVIESAVLNCGKKTDIIQEIENALQKATLKLTRIPEKFLLIAILVLILGASGSTGGMIRAFEVIKSSLCASNADIAIGIEQSLVNSMESAMILLLNMLFFFILRGKISAYILELGFIKERFIAGLKK